jgi:hypothetical protein
MNCTISKEGGFNENSIIFSALCRTCSVHAVQYKAYTSDEFLEPERSSYTWIRAPEKSTPPYALLVNLEGVG